MKIVGYEFFLSTWIRVCLTQETNTIHIIKKFGDMVWH